MVHYSTQIGPKPDFKSKHCMKENVGLE